MRPCLAQAARIRMWDRQIIPQPKRVKRDVRLENHPKTLPDPVFTPMNERRAKSEETTREGQGKPFLVVLLKILGALPEIERP